MAKKTKKVPPHSPETQELDAKTAEKPADIPSEPAAVPEISPRSFPNLEAPVANPEVKTPIINTRHPEASEQKSQPAVDQTPTQPAEKAEAAPALSKESIIEDTPATEYALPEAEKKSGKKFIIIGAAFVLAITAAAALVVIGLNRNKAVENIAPETTKTQEIQTAPPKEEAPAMIFDKTKFTLEILNGSGVAGAAKKIADKLSPLGYEIIKVGNAEEVEKTQVYLSSAMENFKSEFLKDLEADLKEATISGELKDSTASARIIIGKN